MRRTDGGQGGQRRHKGQRDGRGREEMIEMEAVMKGRSRRRRTPQLFGALTNIQQEFSKEGEELRSLNDDDDEGRSERRRRIEEKPSSQFEQRRGGVKEDEESNGEDEGRSGRRTFIKRFKRRKETEDDEELEDVSMMEEKEV